MLIKNKIDNLYGICCFYEGAPNIAELSIRAASIWCNKVIAIDGRYAAFEGKDINSKDGTSEIVKKWADITIDAIEPWEDAMAKRTYALNLVPSENYALIFDIDELLFGSWRDLWLGCKAEAFDVGWIKCHHINRVRRWRPRVIWCSGKMEYRHNHFTIYRNNKKIYEPTFESSREGNIQLPINALHLKTFVNPDYIKRQNEYVKNRKEVWASGAGYAYN